MACFAMTQCCYVLRVPYILWNEYQRVFLMSLHIKAPVSVFTVHLTSTRIGYNYVDSAILSIAKYHICESTATDFCEVLL